MVILPIVPITQPFMSAERSLKLLVAGRVQGVGFRYFARSRAARHGVRGYVRNLADGRVEVVAQAGEAALAAFIEDLRVGPRTGAVRECRTEPLDGTDSYDDFTIRF